jgi:hypothetical protein
MPITTSGLYVSIKLQKSKTLLQILLLFTCNKTNSLSSVMGTTVAADYSSFVSSSVCLLAGCVVTISLSAIFQAISNALGLYSSLCPQMSPRWKSLLPGIVTHSSSSVFHRQYHKLWSKVDLGVSLLFGECEGHLYQSPSSPPNYLGLQK